MFNVGQKVIFVDCTGLARHPDVVYPQLHEKVTIDNMMFSPDGKLFLTINEYPTPLQGKINGILAICFRPIDYSFPNETLERLMKEIKETEEIKKN